MHRIELIIERIHLSKVDGRWRRMNLEHYDNTKLAWLVGIHVLFLGSLLAVVLSDRLSSRCRDTRPGQEEGAGRSPA